MENTIDINYDALDSMIERLQQYGEAFSLDEIRAVFGPVVDDAIAAEQSEASLMVI